MTTKTDALARTDRDFEPFPDLPPREDMQNWLHLYMTTQAVSLVFHLGDPDTTVAGSEIPLVPSLADRNDYRTPDFMVSFGSHPALALEQRAYVIERQGKPPDFVLEVASVSTGIADYTEKRDVYARYGVTEYWRYDPTGGEYHDAALAADRLVDGEYQPIEVEWPDENRCRGYSEALGLYVCWEDGDLRWFDPKTDGYVRTHQDELERAEAESAARRQAEAERDFHAARAQAEAAARARAEAELHDLRRRLQSLEDGE